MKLILIYNDYLKLNEKRRVEHKISIGFRGLVSYFDDSDRELVIKILGKIYRMSGWFSTLFYIFLAVVISNFISSAVLLHAVVSMILIIVKYDSKKISQIKMSTLYLYRTSLQNYKKFYKMFVFKYMLVEVMLKTMLPYGIGYLIYLNKTNENVFMPVLILVLVDTLSLIVIYTLSFYIRYDKELNKKSLLEKITKSDHHVRINMVKGSVDFKYIVRRYMSIGGIKGKINTALVCVGILTLLGSYILNCKLMVNSKIIVLVYLALNPLIIYLLVTLLALPMFVSEEYVRTTHYFIKKYHILNEFVREISLRLILILKYFAIIFLMQIFFATKQFNLHATELIILSVIHCGLVCFLLVLRIHSIYFIEHEDAAVESNDINIYRIIEDYVILGLPFVALGPRIVLLENKGDLGLPLCLFSIFIFFICIYVWIRYQYTFKGEKHVKN